MWAEPQRSCQAGRQDAEKEAFLAKNSRSQERSRGNPGVPVKGAAFSGGRVEVRGVVLQCRLPVVHEVA